MAKITSVKKNFYYNSIYQILTIIIPLITAPYISRVIGPTGNGIYSYTYSIVQYFALFAMLGLNNYGNRSVAKCRNNKEKLSKEFCSIYAMQLMTSLIMLTIYVGYITVFNKKYFIYSLVQLIYLISVCFDINWFFYGLEEFKLTVIRNTIIRLITVIGIFTIVKSEEDLIIYVVLMCISSLISQLILWPFLKKRINFIRPKLSDITKHIIPNLRLFIPVIAISIYKFMDKIMLGNMSTMENVGYYEYAERIINIPLSIITALGTVMLPRISNLVANGQDEKIKFYIDKSIKYMMFLSIPIAVGLIVISPNFIPLFLGEEFLQTAYIIQYLSVTIIFISWANVIRTQYLIPKEKDSIYINSVIIGAVVNFIINIILIPKYQTVGAAIGTIAAEFSVMLYQTIKVRKTLEIKKYLLDTSKFAITGIVMFGVVILLKKIIHNTIGLLIIQVVAGGLVYFILNYQFIKENIIYIPILNKLIKNDR